MILFPSREESRLLVLERVLLTACRELSSYVSLLLIFRLFVGRKRERMHGIDAVTMTKYVSMYNQRS